MTHNGILHQSSCVHIPSQNDVERKNRHHFEAAQAILFQNKSSKRVMGRCSFLTNRMSYFVLYGDIPYSILFPSNSLFPVQPHIFGCTCFARDVHPQVTKLDPKSLKCVFLGYPWLQKGYRCSSPVLKRCYILWVYFLLSVSHFTGSFVSAPIVHVVVHAYSRRLETLDLSPPPIVASSEDPTTTIVLDFDLDLSIIVRQR